jgi:hypothetical protein
MEFHLRTFEALPPQQAEFLAQRRERVTSLYPGYHELRSALLAIGGLEVVLPRYDEFSESQRSRQHYDTQQIIARGRTWIGNDLALATMQDSNCHVNVATLRARGRGTIATGFALSEDGLWREHSWLIQRPESDPGIILETTVGRLLYHGYALTVREQRRFVWSELGLIRWLLARLQPGAA